jgi:TetR/AcrR family transcriptional regulator, transcriptional repressor for nem operon
MRYQPDHKAEVHQKIVKDASRRVRAEGTTGAAVSAVMRDAGLTHGGFYKHFGSKDDLIVESAGEAFTEMGDWLIRVGEQSKPGTAWKAMVKAYLSLKHCDDVACGCPLAALAPELARADPAMKGRIFADLARYKSRMQPFMPGRRTADKERAFFAIFSTMAGAVELARLLPEPAMREKVLTSTRDAVV